MIREVEGLACSRDLNQLLGGYEMDIAAPHNHLMPSMAVGSVLVSQGGTSDSPPDGDRAFHSASDVLSCNQVFRRGIPRAIRHQCWKDFLG